MLLTGTFLRSIDEKLRLPFPKRLREALGPSQTVLFIGPGTDGSLVLYGEEEFSKLAERLADASPTRKEVRAYRRLFFSQAERVELDAQGRFRIPARLAELAGLDKEAVLLGVQDHLELWDRKRWESYVSEQAGQYDQLAENAFEQGS